MLPRAFPWRQHPPLGTPINWSHPLAQGLVACIDAQGDHVSGNPFVAGSSLDYPLGDGRFACSYYATVGLLPQLARIGTAFTLVSFCAPIGAESWGKFFSIPYRNDSSWYSPCVGVCFGEYSSTGNLSFDLGDSAASMTGVHCPSCQISTDGTPGCYAISKTSNGILFYKNGSVFDDYSFHYGSSLDVAPYFGNGAALALGCRAVKTIGEGIDGIYGPQLIYARALSVEELQSLDDNPYQLYQPVRRFWPVSEGIPCGKLSLAGLAPDFRRAVSRDVAGVHDLSIVRDLLGSHRLPVSADVVGAFLSPGYARDIVGVHSLPGRFATDFPGSHALPLGVSHDLSGRYDLLSHTPVTLDVPGRHHLPYATAVTRVCTVSVEVTD